MCNFTLVQCRLQCDVILILSEIVNLEGYGTLSALKMEKWCNYKSTIFVIIIFFTLCRALCDRSVAICRAWIFRASAGSGFYVSGLGRAKLFCIGLWAFFGLFQSIKCTYFFVLCLWNMKFSWLNFYNFQQAPNSARNGPKIG